MSHSPPESDVVVPPVSSTDVNHVDTKKEEVKEVCPDDSADEVFDEESKIKTGKRGSLKVDQDVQTKNEDVRASLNAMFAKQVSKKLVSEPKAEEEEKEVIAETASGGAGPGTNVETNTVQEADSKPNLPAIVIEESEEDKSQSNSKGMKSADEKKPRFGFFRKSKKTEELSVESGDKSSDGSVKSGGFSRRNKTFNPFKSVRKAVHRIRGRPTPTPPPAPEQPPVPEIVEPEPIDVDKLEQLKSEVVVVEDIRKNRPRGPQGRKRRSMRPSSTMSGSECGTPVVAQLDDLLQNGNQVNGTTETDDKSRGAVSRNAVSRDEKVNGVVDGDVVAMGDIGNLAASSTSQETKQQDISVGKDFITSALGTNVIVDSGDEADC